MTYVPPQIDDEQHLDDLTSRYKHNFRRLFIEVSRVRFDGVYISVNHYVYGVFCRGEPVLIVCRRDGLSDNPWYNVSQPHGGAGSMVHSWHSPSI